jgi:hypothetical protein
MFNSTNSTKITTYFIKQQDYTKGSWISRDSKKSILGMFLGFHEILTMGASLRRNERISWTRLLGKQEKSPHVGFSPPESQQIKLEGVLEKTPNRRNQGGRGLGFVCVVFFFYETNEGLRN